MGDEEKKKVAEEPQESMGDFFDEMGLDDILNPKDEDLDEDVTPSDEELEEVEDPPEEEEEVEEETEDAVLDEEDEGGGEEEEGEAEEEEEPEEEEEAVDYLAILNQQAAEIAELKKGVVKEEPAEEEEVVEQDVQPAAEESSVKLEPIDFLKDLDIDDVAAEPETFNQVMNSVLKHATTIATQQVLRSIPNVVYQQVNYVTQIQRVAEAWWKENEDLKPVTNLVTQAIDKEAAENPGKSFEEIFNEAGKKIRKTLGLAKKVVEKDGVDDNPSILPTKTTSRKQRATAKSKLQRDLDDMLDFQP